MFCSALLSAANKAPPSHVDLIGLQNVSTRLNMLEIGDEFCALLLTRVLLPPLRRIRRAQVAGSRSLWNFG